MRGRGTHNTANDAIQLFMNPVGRSTWRGNLIENGEEVQVSDTGNEGLHEVTRFHVMGADVIVDQTRAECGELHFLEAVHADRARCLGRYVVPGDDFTSLVADDALLHEGFIRSCSVSIGQCNS